MRNVFLATLCIPGVLWAAAHAHDQMSESKIDKANLDKEYMDKMLQVISAKKLFKVLGAEMKFRRRIFKQYGHESGKRRAEMNP